MQSKIVTRFLNVLTESEKDQMYRALWITHVKEDIRTYSEDTDQILTEDDIDTIADRYVYQGDYDCNLSYWDNIQALIDEIKRK